MLGHDFLGRRSRPEQPPAREPVDPRTRAANLRAQLQRLLAEAGKRSDSEAIDRALNDSLEAGAIVLDGVEDAEGASLMRRAADIPVRMSSGLWRFGSDLSEVAGARGPAAWMRGTAQTTRENLSPEQVRADAAVADADGFWGTIGAALRNPSVIAGVAAESLPSMGLTRLGYEVARRGAAYAARRAAQAGAGSAASGVERAAALAARPAVKAPLSEGAAMGIHQYGGLRAEGVEEGRARRAALATAAAGAGVSRAGSAAARRIGGVDPDEILRAGRQASAREALMGAPAEAIEEALQEGGEQVAGNIAREDPVTKGVLESAALGSLAGFAMAAPGTASMAAARPYRHAAAEGMRAAGGRIAEDARREGGQAARNVRRAGERAVQTVREAAPGVVAKAEQARQTVSETGERLAKAAPGAVEAGVRRGGELAREGVRRADEALRQAAPAVEGAVSATKRGVRQTARRASEALARARLKRQAAEKVKPEEAKPAPEPAPAPVPAPDPTPASGRPELEAAITQRRDHHAEVMRREPDSPAGIDARHRFERAEPMLAAMRNPSPRLAAELDRIEKSSATAEMVPNLQAQAVARDVVASRVAQRFRDEGNTAAAARVDEMTDANLRRYWIAADAKGGGGHAARLRNPAYQEEYLRERIRAQIGDGKAPEQQKPAPPEGGQADTGSYDHEVDTGRRESGRITEHASTKGDENSAAVFPATRQRLPAHYAVVEAEDAIPSHTEGGAKSPEARYPSAMQARDYGPGTKYARAAERAAMDPDLVSLTSTSPSVAEGMPTLLPSGAAVAGNQRLMIARRQYSRGPAEGEAYRNRVLAAAERLGMKVPEGVKQPVLVRVLEPSAQFADAGSLRDLNRASDTPVSKAKTVEEIAAGRAGGLASTLSLMESVEEGETLAKFLGRIGRDRILNALVADEVLTPEEFHQYVETDAKGKERLNDAGILFMRAQLRQRALRSPSAAASMPSWLRAKLDDSWHVVVAAEENTAIPLHEGLSALSKYAADAEASGADPATFFKQGELYGDSPPEILGQFSKRFADMTATEIRAAFGKMATVTIAPGFFETQTLPGLLESSFGVTAPWAWGRSAKIDQAVANSLGHDSMRSGHQEMRSAEVPGRGSGSGRRRPMFDLDPAPPNVTAADGKPSTGDPASRPGVDRSVTRFDVRDAVELIDALAGKKHRVQVPSVDRAKKMLKRGTYALAMPKGLRVLIEPETWARLDGGQRAALLAHELGHIAEYVERNRLDAIREVTGGDRIGRIQALLGQLGIVGRSMRSLRKLRDLAVIGQMKDVSRRWRPYPDNAPKSYMRYRAQFEEVFADFYSAVLVNPDFVRAHAPDAWNAFHDHMPDATKPHYLALRELLAGGEEAKVEHDREWLESLEAERATAFRRRVEEENRRRSLSWWDLGRNGMRMAQLLFKRKLSVRRLEAAAEAKGVVETRRLPTEVLANEPDLDFELPYRFEEAFRAFNDADVRESDVDRYLLLNRIIEGDPTINEEALEKELELAIEQGREPADVQDFVKFIDKLNPGGMTPERAQNELNDLVDGLSPGQREGLLTGTQHVYNALRQAVLEAADAQLISRRQAEVFLQAKAYAPYAMLAYGGSPSVSGLSHERRGSTRTPDRMMQTAVDKVGAMLRAANTNRAQNMFLEMMDALRQAEPDKAEKIPTIALRPNEVTWQRSRHTPGGRVPGLWMLTESAQREYGPEAGVMSVMVRGKRKFFLVDDLVLDVFRSSRTLGALQVLAPQAVAVRYAFITLQMSWQAANFIRDPQRTQTNIPEYAPGPAGVGQVFADIVRSLPVAWEARRGWADLLLGQGVIDPSSPRGKRVAQLLQAQTEGFLPMSGRLGILQGEDLKERSGSLSVSEFMKNPLEMPEAELTKFEKYLADHPVAEWVNRNVRKPFQAAEQVMRVVETANKLAPWRRIHMVHGADVPYEAKRNVRLLAGTPPADRTERGLSSAMGLIWQFGPTAATGHVQDTAALDPRGGNKHLAARRALNHMMWASYPMTMAVVKYGAPEPDDEDDSWGAAVTRSIKGVPDWMLATGLPIPYSVEDGRAKFFVLPTHFWSMPIKLAFVKLVKGAMDPERSGLRHALAPLEFLGNSLKETFTSFPGVSPGLDWARDTAVVATGGNPVNEFYGTTYFSEDEMRGTSGGRRMATWLLWHTLRTFGGEWAARIATSAAGLQDMVPQERVGAAVASRLPIVGPIERRFLYDPMDRSSGIVESQVEASARVAARESEERLVERDYKAQRVAQFHLDNAEARPERIVSFVDSLADDWLAENEGNEDLLRDPENTARSIRSSLAANVLTRYPRWRFMALVLRGQTTERKKAALESAIRSGVRRSEASSGLEMAVDAGALNPDGATYMALRDVVDASG